MRRRKKHLTLVYLAEDDNARELGLGVVWDGRVKDEDTYPSGQMCRL